MADIDIPRLLEFHKSHGRLATVTTVPPISRFGIMDIDRKRGPEFHREAEVEGMGQRRVFRA